MQEEKPQIPHAESATGTFTRLAPWTLGARFFVMIMAIAGTSILTRYMTKEEWNAYSLLKNLWWFVWMLGSLGLNEAVLRFTAELSARKDTKGFHRLLGKVLFVQLFAMALIFAAFLLLQGFFEAIWQVSFGAGIAVLVLFSAITTWKETLRQAYIAAYWMRMVAVVSFISALMFPVAGYVYVVRFHLGASAGLLAEGTGFVLMFVVFLTTLPRLKMTGHPGASRGSDAEEESRSYRDDGKGLTPVTPAGNEEVTNYRIFRYAGAIVSNNAMSLVFGQQMVVFIIGHYLGSAGGAAGIYNLAGVIPGQAFGFLTLAIVPFVQAIFTKTYYHDHSRLPELVRSYYKLMIILILPSIVIGLLFMDKALEVLSGDRGVEAGNIAVMLLPLQFIIILVVPISAALNVLEKSQRLIIWRLLAVVGLAMYPLFLPFWPRLNTVVVIEYAREIIFVPIIMSLAVRLVGGFWFPFRFLLRAALSCAPLALLYPLRILWPYVADWGLVHFHHKIVGLSLMLIIALALSAAVFAVSVRLFRLFDKDELKYFRNARFPGVRFVERLLVSRAVREQTEMTGTP
jgi:O-antigen/teichoic acid export membrane protein